MYFDVFLSFDGDCRAALEFYTKVFQQEFPNVMTYGQVPEGDVPEADRDRILYADIPIFGIHLMLADCPSGSDFVKGNNTCLSIGTTDAAELKRLYTALSEDGEVEVPLGETFFSELFGMVTDKFGVTWQLGLALAQTA